MQAFDPLGFEEGLVPLTPKALTMADFLDSFLAIYDGRDVPLNPIDD